MTGRIIRFLLILVPLILGQCSSLPPWNPVPTGQSAVYATIETDDTTLGFISFSDYPDIVAVSVDHQQGGFNPRYALIVEPSERAALREACDKYFAWQKLAVDNQVEITKGIRTVMLGQMYGPGPGWRYGGTREVRFVFSSRRDAEDTPNATLRVITMGYFTERDQFVLDYGQVKQLSDALQDSAVAGGYQAAKKKQQTIDMFK
jgi:hypothetical protein